MTWAAAGAAAIGAFTGWTIPLQIGELRRLLGWSAEWAGTMLTADMLIVSTTMILATRTIRTMPAEHFARAGAILAVSGFGLVAWSGHLPVLASVGLLVSAVGQGLANVGAVVLPTATDAPGRSYALSTTFGVVFGAACLFLLPAMRFAPLGADPLFLAVAMAMGICLLLTLVTGWHPVHSVAAAIEADGLRLDGTVLAALAGCFLLFAGALAVWSFAEPLGSRLGLTSQAVGMVLSVAAIASVLGPLSVAWFDRTRNLAVVLSLAFAVTGLAFLVSCVTGSRAVFTAAMVAQSVGQVAVTNLTYIVFVRIDAVGRLANLGMGAVQFGSAAGPLLGACLIGFGAAPLGLVALGLSAIAWTAVAWCERMARPAIDSGALHEVARVKL